MLILKQRPRVYYTDKQKDFMWERWKQGDSMHEIAALFDRNHTLVQGLFSSTGGIRPSPRKRSSIALTLAEREDISRGLASKQSIRSIADCLKRSPSTVSREINRNGGPRRYRGGKAAVATYFADNQTRSIEGEVTNANAFETDVWQQTDYGWKIVSLHYNEIKQN